jgi:hypothetical protein
MKKYKFTRRANYSTVRRVGLFGSGYLARLMQILDYSHFLSDEVQVCKQT